MATSMTMGQLIQPVTEAQATSQAMGQAQTDQVMKMANAMQSLQDKQMQHQEMEQKLQDMQWNSAKGMLNTYMNASPNVRRALKKQMGSRLKQINADPAILDSLDDQDMEQNARIAMQAFGNDPAAAAQGMALLSSVSAFEPQVSSLAQMAQQRASLLQTQELKKLQMQHQQEMLAARLATTERGQDISKAKGQISAGRLLDAREEAAVNKLTQDKQVQQAQSGILQAKKDYDLIQEAKKPNGLDPLVAEEVIQSYVSLLKGMSNRSTGSEREKLASAAMDLQTRGNAWLQKVKPQGFVKYNDQPFLQDLEKKITGLHGTLKNAMQTQLNAKIRQSGLPSVNVAQQAAYDKLLKGAELGYKPGVEAVAPSAPQEAPAAEAVTLESRAAKAGFNIKAARDARKTDAQIDAFLKAKGF